MDNEFIIKIRTSGQEGPAVLKAALDGGYVQDAITSCSADDDFTVQEATVLLVPCADHQEKDVIINGILDILYPDGDPEHEHGSEELGLIVDLLSDYHLVPNM